MKTAKVRNCFILVASLTLITIFWIAYRAREDRDVSRPPPPTTTGPGRLRVRSDLSSAHRRADNRSPSKNGQPQIDRQPTTAMRAGDPTENARRQHRDSSPRQPLAGRWNRYGRINPAPVTKPFERRLAHGAVELVLKVLPDGKNADPNIVGYTHVEFSEYRYPAYRFDVTTKKITRFLGRFQWTGPITIQTQYGPTASRHVPSLYGRGTTDEDIQNGDRTLGFHESCHRRDYVEYVTSHALPVLQMERGMTVEQYEAAVSLFKKQCEDYAAAMLADSERRTDEVGRKRSSFLFEESDQEPSGG